MKSYDEWKIEKSDILNDKFIDKNYDDFEDYCEEEYNKERQLEQNQIKTYECLKCQHQFPLHDNEDRICPACFCKDIKEMLL